MMRLLPTADKIDNNQKQHPERNVSPGSANEKAELYTRMPEVSAPNSVELTCIAATNIGIQTCQNIAISDSSQE